MACALGGAAGPALELAPPRTLLAWLPYLWRRVLFPGTAAAPSGPASWAHLLILLLVPGVLLYPSLRFRLLEPDEGRYAEIPREMLQRGEWIVPRLQGEPYLDKPPLFYWLVMASYKVCGVRDWAARLVPALALHLCILAVYLLGRRSLGAAAAFRGALLLGLVPGFLSVGRLLILDGLLTLWTTLALLCAFEAVRGPFLQRRWWLAAAVAAGLGVLTKGPVALVLLAPPLWLYPRLSGQGARVTGRAVLIFLLVVLAINLPWYGAMCLRLPRFARYFLWEHNVKRFVTGLAHERGVWFYLPVLALGLFPASLLALPFLRFLASGDDEAARWRSPALGFFLLASGWCVLFFSLSTCKLPTYVMPAFPPLALALGVFLAHTAWGSPRRAGTGAVVGFALLAGLHHGALPWYANYRSPLGRQGAVSRLCADPRTPVVCYPRNCDSVAFYLRRDDLRNYRSKDIELLRGAVRSRPRTVILCTHRHSLAGLRQLLPPEVPIVHSVHIGLEQLPGVPRRLAGALVHLMGGTALGLCDVAVVEHHPFPPPPPLPFPPGSYRPAPPPPPRPANRSGP